MAFVLFPLIAVLPFQLLAVSLVLSAFHHFHDDVDNDDDDDDDYDDYDVGGDVVLEYGDDDADGVMMMRMRRSIAISTMFMTKDLVTTTIAIAHLSRTILLEGFRNKAESGIAVYP